MWRDRAAARQRRNRSASEPSSPEPFAAADNKGIKGWFFKRFQKKAGGAVPSANRITLLRDADGDGLAETRSVFVSGLNSPFGMALVGDAVAGRRRSDLILRSFRVFSGLLFFVISCFRGLLLTARSRSA